jgi:DNA uptake protein ComE-like DNA-binding protein
MKLSIVGRAQSFALIAVALVFANVQSLAVFAAMNPATGSKAPATIDLNKATEAQLQDVPGIGEGDAKKIVKGRPYKSIDDLSKAGIPSATISKIRSRVSITAEKPIVNDDKATSTASANKPTTTSDKPVSKNAKPTSANSKPAVVDPKTAPINLNKASETELETVAGIGPTYARKIIANRPYKSIDDLSKAGIPAATIAKIRPLVSLSDSATTQTVAKPVTPDTTPALLDVNKATEAQLQEVTGIGEAYSKKIVDGRPYKSVDDLSKTGISSAVLEKIKSQLTVGGVTAPPAKGMVWVNLDTKLYHKESSRWYGKTKSGKYMSETEAINAGYKASKR